MTHYLKIEPQYFDDVLKENKRFEIRKDDREFNVGDNICLQEFDNENQVYTGREVIVEVLYVLKDIYEYGLKEGYILLSIKLSSPIYKCKDCLFFAQSNKGIHGECIHLNTAVESYFKCNLFTLKK